MAHDIFICHAHADINTALAACAKLEEASVRCWIAPRNVGAGPYARQLVQAIANAAAVLLIFSDKTNASEHVLRELEIASNRQKVIIPFRIEDVRPNEDLEYFTLRVHWLDALTPPLESRLDELVAFVQRLLAAGPVPAPPVSLESEAERERSEIDAYELGARAEKPPDVAPPDRQAPNEELAPRPVPLAAGSPARGRMVGGVGIAVLALAAVGLAVRYGPSRAPALAPSKAPARAIVATALPTRRPANRGAVEAVVNGEPIYRSDFLHQLERGKTSGSSLLGQMIQTSLIDQYARKKNIEVSQAEIDRREVQLRAKYSSDAFDQILKSQGYTAQDLHQILKGQAILEMAVAPQIHVSEAEITAYFAKKHATLDTAERVRVRHVLVADAKTAATVLAKLKADPSNANWAAVAKQYSTDPSTKDKGGELGFITRGQVVAPFEAASFGAKVGQVIGPVKSPFGYHIMQVEEKTAARKVTLASAHDQIRALLVQQQEANAVPLFIQQLRKAARVTVLDPTLKAAWPT